MSQLQLQFTTMPHNALPTKNGKIK